MKIPKGFAVGAYVAVALTTYALAGDRALFTKSGYVPLSQEASVLDAAGRKQIAMWRESPTNLNVSVALAEPSALETGTLTLVTPDGASHRYVGTKVDATTRGGSPGYFIWSGKSSSDVQNIRDGFDDAMFATNGQSVSGRFRARGRWFVVNSTTGKHLLIAEANPNFREADDTPKSQTKPAR